MSRSVGGRIATATAGVLLVVGGVVVYLLFLPDLDGPVSVPSFVGADLQVGPPYDYRGVLHIHTDASHDGVGTWEDLRRASGRHGLNFVLVTDHNTRAWADRGLEGWQDGLLVIVGMERGTPQGHLIDVPVVRRGRPSGRPALMIVAHPTNPKFPWQGPVPPGAALEIWSGDTAWRSHTYLSIAARVLAGGVNLPRALASLASRPTSDLALWDSKNTLSPRGRRSRSGRGRGEGAVVPGVAGNDSHGGLPLLRDREGRPSLRLRWPSYDAALGFGLTHVLLPKPLSGHAARDREAVIAALAAGHAYVANEGLYPVTGFRFECRGGSPDPPAGASGEAPLRTGRMGDRVPISRHGWVTLRASVPASGRIETALFRDGREICRVARPTMTVRVREPGAYRVEVTYGDAKRPWIFSNPIRLYWS